ncbi:MAG: bifunctional phosphoribosylaminoimidazolecarboxamide formyltransferase/IMP cyclohydrolase [Candidatus Sumerlaeaceae bacterium]
MSQIKTALLSLHDKTGLETFGRSLTEHGVEILSTGGTLAFLRERGIPATSVSEYTGQAEILGGRVKTLHPKIFAGILARRDNPEDMKTLEEQGVRPIDLVAVSLYPFEETIARVGVTLDDAVEQIDIGGVSLIRAAAKNFKHVVVCSSRQSMEVAEAMVNGSFNGDDEAESRQALAWQALLDTSQYDAKISEYLNNQIGQSVALEQALENREKEILFPADLLVGFEKLQDLRYGENPHQRAAFYQNSVDAETSVANAKQLHGKELSYNNILDLDAALEIARSFPESPACVIIKHNNPCGVAKAEKLVDAYKAARECDPTSSFGGIVGLNREVDAETAEEVGQLFLEAVIAPGYSDEALATLTKKKNIRVLSTGAFSDPAPQMMLRSVVGGLLVQDRDMGVVMREGLKVVSKERPTEEDIDGLLFAWRVAKFTKSNAIVYTSKSATIGIGAGQMSRIDSTNIGAVKAQRPVRGAYMASDAFFPFRDNVDRAADIGIRAIIQPGGSVRDEEVITAADEHHMILVFTGMRHFRH